LFLLLIEVVELLWREKSGKIWSSDGIWPLSDPAPAQVASPSIKSKGLPILIILHQPQRPDVPTSHSLALMTLAPL
jgi:hypothetical protein